MTIAELYDSHILQTQLLMQFGSLTFSPNIVHSQKSSKRTCSVQPEEFKNDKNLFE